MRSSAATLGSRSDPHLYQGQVIALSRDTVELALHDSAGGSLTVSVRLRPNDAGTVTGTLQAAA